MLRAIVVLFVVISLGACTQRTICPAYQSAYIYDKEALRKKFSYFEDDSIPKVLTASKNKYLIAEPVTYRKKVRTLQTVVMKDVNPVVPDSMTMDDDFVSEEELDRAARSVIDSTFIVDVPREPKDSVAAEEEDSVYVISKDKEVRLMIFKPDSMVYRVEERRFNIDQDNYMWYLRDYLVLPDVRLAQQQGSGGDNASGPKEKKGIKGFFKNLFKKKKKQAPDSTVTAPPDVAPEDEQFEFVQQRDSAQTSEEPQQQVEKKKGIFSFLKKDKSEKKPKAPKEKKEKKPKKEKAKKEEEVTPKKEEGDDGF